MSNLPYSTLRESSYYKLLSLNYVNSYVGSGRRKIVEVALPLFPSSVVRHKKMSFLEKRDDTSKIGIQAAITIFEIALFLSLSSANTDGSYLPPSYLNVG